MAGLSGPPLVFYRVFVMLALVGGVILLWRSELSVPRRRWPALILFGLSTGLVGSALFSVAFLPVTVAAVVFYTFPVLVVLAEPLLTRTRPRLERIVVVLVALRRRRMVARPDCMGSIRAARTRAARQPPRRCSSSPPARSARPDAAKAVLVASDDPAGDLPDPAAHQRRHAAAAWRPALAPIAVLVTIGGYLVGFLWQVLALARVAPGPAALAFCAEPVFAVVIAAAVLGERVGMLQYAGGGLVVAGRSCRSSVIEQKRGELRSWRSRLPT